jgi:hypothetical protein
MRYYVLGKIRFNLVNYQWGKQKKFISLPHYLDILIY